MSEERAPMKPALGLVKDRLNPLPPRRNTTQTPRLSPALEEALADDPRAETVAQPEETSEKPAASPRQDRKPKKAPRAKPSETTGGMKRTTLSLPQELVDQLADRRKANPKISQVQFILNSLADTRHQLKELVAADNAGAVGNDLFPVASATRTVVERRTTISFDTAEQNMKIIDDLVESSGASTRSQLIRVALRHVLNS